MTTTSTAPATTSSRPPQMIGLDANASIYSMIRYGVKLENTGSTARDHLANERTYLAWIRTALALVGVGLGLIKVQSIANVAGYLVLGMGVVVLVNSTLRYLHVMRRLASGTFEPNILNLIISIIMGIIIKSKYLNPYSKGICALTAYSTFQGVAQALKTLLFDVAALRHHSKTLIGSFSHVAFAKEGQTTAARSSPAITSLRSFT